MTTQEIILILCIPWLIWVGHVLVAIEDSERYKKMKKLADKKKGITK